MVAAAGPAVSPAAPENLVMKEPLERAVDLTVVVDDRSAASGFGFPEASAVAMDVAAKAAGFAEGFETEEA